MRSCLRFSAALLTVLTTYFPTAAAAQKTEAEISARLVGQPLYLRGMWAYDKLKFDGTGEPEGKYEVAPFTVCGMDVSTVKLRGDRLQIEGQRVAISFEPDGDMRRRPLTVGKRGGDREPEKLSVEIHGFAGEDFTAALDKVFTDSLATMAPALPEIWQKYAAGHFLPAGTPSAAAAAPTPAAVPGPAPDPATRGIRHISGGVKPPRLLHTVDPAFSEEARQMKYSGNVQVYLWVDENGLPSHIRIAKPTGMGLDEAAAEAVSKYKFSPAMKDGVPVRVDLYVEVNFQIF